MKAGQLAELLKELEFDDYMPSNSHKKAFYENILRLASEDVEKVLEVARRDGDYMSLLQFYLFYETHKDEEEFQKGFSRLEIPDIKEIILKRIMEPNDSLQIGNLIAEFYDEYLMDCFINKEEYFAYLDGISTYSTPSVLANTYRNQFLFYILSSFKDEKNRMDAMSNVFQIYTITESKLFLDRNILTMDEKAECRILELVNIGYNYSDVLKLFSKWTKDQYMYEETFQSIMSCPYPQLIRFLLESEYDHYGDIFTFIEELSSKGSDGAKVLLEVYLNNPYHDHQLLLNEALREIENTSDTLDNEKLLYDFAILLQKENFKKIFSSDEDENEKQEKISLIIAKLLESYQCKIDEKRTFTVQTLSKLPYEIWRRIPISDVEEGVLTIIFENYGVFVDRGLIDESDEKTYPMIERISALSKDALNKIVDLFEDNLSFCSDYVEKREYFNNILFDKENEASLDYIASVYNHAEKERKNSYELREKLQSTNDDVTLYTVLDLLPFYPVEKLLDGFEDEEEITPKTLLRSLKYLDQE